MFIVVALEHVVNPYIGTGMKAAVPVLLCLLSALVEVHSQTVPYVSFMGTNLPNHSYVDLTAVGDSLDGSNSVQCHTDLYSCCSGNQGADRGDWYFPNGDRLPFSGGGDIYERRVAQQVYLHRRNNGDTSGIYRCDIETSVINDDDGQETVYVGLYASGGKCMYILLFTITYQSILIQLRFQLFIIANKLLYVTCIRPQLITHDHI